jgi:hypothetical protein
VAAEDLGAPPPPPTSVPSPTPCFHEAGVIFGHVYAFFIFPIIAPNVYAVFYAYQPLWHHSNFVGCVKHVSSLKGLLQEKVNLRNPDKSFANNFT